MTQEEKARAYDEALDRCKEWASGTCGHNVADSPKDIAEFIFPQLAESKDEKIREFLIGILSQGTWRKEWPFSPNEVVAYLEKQNHVQSDTEKEYVRTLKSLIFNFLSGKDEVDRDYYQRIEDWLNERHIEQKEQKLADDTTFEKWLDDWYQGSKEAGGDVVMSEAEFKNWSRGIRNMYQQKSAEWSDEDKAMIKSILFVLESYVSQSESASSPSLITTYPTYYKEIDWLKSLRPQSHWKPSEEQIEALKNVAFGNYQNGDGPVLRGLYEQLKRLM